MGIMENKMETTILCKDIYRGYKGMMEIENRPRTFRAQELQRERGAWGGLRGGEAWSSCSILHVRLAPNLLQRAVCQHLTR